MFHDISLNNRIDRMHKRALQIAYEDYEYNCPELFRIDNAASIHQKNLQLLMKEINKTKPGLQNTNYGQRETPSNQKLSEQQLSEQIQ